MVKNIFLFTFIYLVVSSIFVEYRRRLKHLRQKKLFIPKQHHSSTTKELINDINDRVKRGHKHLEIWNSPTDRMLVELDHLGISCEEYSLRWVLRW